MPVNEVALALLVGVTVGAIFSLVGLPIPAPRALSGVMGIIGIYLGYKLATYLTANWDQIASLLSF